MTAWHWIHKDFSYGQHVKRRRDQILNVFLFLSVLFVLSFSSYISLFLCVSIYCVAREFDKAHYWQKSSTLSCVPINKRFSFKLWLHIFLFPIFSFSLRQNNIFPYKSLNLWLRHSIETAKWKSKSERERVNILNEALKVYFSRHSISR